MEVHVDLAPGNRDVGWGVDEIAEDVACLSVRVTTHALGQQTVEAAGDDQQGHIEIDLETDGRG